MRERVLEVFREEPDDWELRLGDLEWENSVVYVESGLLWLDLKLWLVEDVEEVVCVEVGVEGRRRGAFISKFILE